MALATPSTVPAERTKRSGSAPSPVASAVMSAARNTATADTARSRAWHGTLARDGRSRGAGRRAPSRGSRRRLPVVHASPGLEIGVYVLVAPEPDRQQPHELDEVYVVLEGSVCWRSTDARCRSKKGKRYSSLQVSSTGSRRTNSSRCWSSSTDRTQASDRYSYCERFFTNG